MPKTREEFWRSKFAANVSRDLEVRQALEQEGWRVFVIWECEVYRSAELERLRRSIESLGGHG
jgi:DNA mismatch endonuclease (patch repair protein)